MQAVFPVHTLNKNSALGNWFIGTGSSVNFIWRIHECHSRPLGRLHFRSSRFPM